MIDNLPTSVLVRSAPLGMIDSLPNLAFGQIQHSTPENEVDREDGGEESEDEYPDSAFL